MINREPETTLRLRIIRKQSANINRTLKRLGIVRPRSTQPKQDSFRLAGRGTRRPEKRTLAKKKGKKNQNKWEKLLEATKATHKSKKGKYDTKQSYRE